MTARAKRVLIASAIGLVSLGSAAFFYPVMLPGLLLAAPIWPQGIHSSNFGPLSGIFFLATISLGTAAFWGGIAYMLMAKPWRT